VSILDAIADPQYFGALESFRDLSTWQGWLVFVKAVYGQALDAAELGVFQKHTGRSAPRPGGYPEAVAVTGCQSGKSQVAAVIAVFEAIEAAQRGERGVYVPLIAQDARGAQRALFGYVREALDLPLLRPELVRDTTDALELRGGVTVAVYPCRPAAIRGIRAAAVIIDELAFFVATDGRATDTEMLRAARSRVATTGGRILILSSPYAQRGALWDLHRRHYGQDTAVLVWQASAPEMNPCLPVDYLERMREDDPEAYRSEVLGEFRAGLASLFDPESLDAVVASGCRERAPVPGQSYRAFVDPSGGRADAFTVGIGHRAAERVVVDVVRAWRPPFNPSGVVEEAAALLKSYGVHSVTGDRYGGEWPREAFRSHGITYELANSDKSDLYLAMLPVVNAGAVELLDLPELLRELRGLERRRGMAGRDRVDHARGAHDDQANAVAGLVSLLRVAAAPVSAVSEKQPTQLRADYRTGHAATERLFGVSRAGLRQAR
jgi:hypothetical protein